MKKTVFIFSFLLLPGLATAQVDQDKFLQDAKGWVAANLKCYQYGDGDEGDHNDPSMGDCHFAGYLKPIFCHLFTPQSTQLVVEVTGSEGQRVGGWSEVEEQYIMFTYYNGKLLADVFYKDKGGNMKKIETPDKPDLIWIGDSVNYCGTTQARLFAGRARKMREILECDFDSTCHQTDEGFNTMLIPNGDKAYHVLKMEIFGISGQGGGKVSESDYLYNGQKDAYEPLGEEREFSFVAGVFDWMENLGKWPQGDHDLNYEEVIMQQPAYLGELVDYMKLDHNDAKWKHAHGILTDIAGKDLGDSYQVWAEWTKSQNSR